MFVVFSKEIRESLRNRQFVMTALLLPVFFVGMAVFQFRMVMGAAGSRGAAQGAAIIGGTVLMMLSLIPMISSQILAAYSFAGEKVQRTLEPLLAAPLSDAELLGGKLFAAWMPGQVIGWLATLTFLTLTGWWSPDSRAAAALPPELVALVSIVLQPLVGLTPCLLSIIVSSRVTEVRAAMQWGGMSVLPVVALFMVFSFLGLRYGALILFVGVAFILLLDAVLFLVAMALFSREKLISKWA